MPLDCWHLDRLAEECGISKGKDLKKVKGAIPQSSRGRVAKLTGQNVKKKQALHLIAQIVNFLHVDFRECL